MKFKQMMMVAAAGIVGVVGFSMPTHAEETTVGGEIKAGPLTMTTPNDVTFDVTLNGADQSVVLDDITTSVSDYRGATTGWTLSVQSPNHNDYSSNFNVLIDDQEITDASSNIKEDTSLALGKDLTFTTAIKVFKEAKQGTYAADLVWNLEPTVQIAE